MEPMTRSLGRAGHRSEMDRWRITKQLLMWTLAGPSQVPGECPHGPGLP
jgi:hypothetical protein